MYANSETVAFSVYVFIAFGGFSTGNSSAFAAFVENLLFIGVYLSLTIGCASGFTRHTWRLIKMKNQPSNGDEQSVGLLERTVEDDLNEGTSK